MNKNHSLISIPPNQAYLGAASQFISAVASEAGLSSVKNESLFQSSQYLLREVFRNSTKGNFTDYIKINIFLENEVLKIEFLNKNLPLPTDLQLQRADWSESLELENLGSGGQKLTLSMPLDTKIAETKKNQLQTKSEPQIQIRQLLDGEEKKLTELFFNVYGYHYIHSYVYYPEQLQSLRKNGDLISFVACDENNQLVGHVGLVRLNQSPVVFEAALGVVDPRTQSRGLFSQIFESAMEHSKTISMSYCVFDLVTNLDFTQKLVSRYGAVDLALFIGCQSKENQASLKKLGIGSDPEGMDRYSLLLSISPRESSPFGKSITLPSNLGESFSSVFQELNLAWQPSPRFDYLSREGDFVTTRQESQKAVIFDLHKPGRAALRRIVEVWHQLVREGYQYAGVNVPIQSPGLAYVYDFLSTKGFFIAGLVPYHYTQELGFRFQALGPTRVAFDKIKVFSNPSQKLLKSIKEDYLRNSFL